MNIKILHVEDDEVVRMAVQRMVRTEGLPYDIVSADTIDKAVELLAGRHYDIVLLDYMLPDGTGLDLLPKVREIPVIFVTGSGDANIAVRAMKGGAYDFLIKDTDSTFLKLLPASIDKVRHTFHIEQEHKMDMEQLAIMNAELGRLYEETKELSLRDPLTGLANRRMMNIDLDRSVARVKRSNEKLSVLMLDIDHFKKYNDTHGHQAGDRLLAAIAKVLTEEVRDADLVARYGGEEFIALLPNTDIEGACNVAERMRKAVSMSLGVTVSIGAAVYQREERVEELVGRADKALYQAKENGRDRVEADIGYRESDIVNREA